MSTFEDYIKLLPERVIINTDIITPELLGQDFLLHLSTEKNKSKPYIPFISRRQGNSEDNTTPRVTVSDYILGCIHGYYTMVNEIFTNPDGLRGLYINLLPFEYALKPNAKLVFDQSRSNEHWLIPYDEEHKEYKFERIGKVFIVNLIIEPDDSDNKYNASFDIFLEIDSDRTIKFSPKITLERGYYHIRNITDTMTQKTSYKDDKNVICETISKSEYLAQKRISAGLLNHTDRPLITRW